jgi:hypothetical protein
MMREPEAALLDVLIEFERGDPEAFSYAHEIAKIFSASGVEAEKIRGAATSYLLGIAFGLHMVAAPEIDASVIVDAFTKADIPLTIAIKDLSTHLSQDRVAPNLYIFIARRSHLQIFWRF